MSYIGNINNFDYKCNDWPIFKGRLEQFFKVNSVEDENKSGILLTYLTDDSYRLVTNLAYPEKLEILDYAALVKLLDNHFKRRQCSFVDKAKFYGATRNESESLNDWAARLRDLATYCEFGNALESNLRDRFVLGMNTGPERDKLFQQNASTLPMSEAINIAAQAECAKEARTVVIKEEPFYYSTSEKRYGGSSASRPAVGGGGGARSGPGGGARSGPAGLPGQHDGDRRCAVCGMRNHDEDKCRFKGYRCQKCGVRGHLKKVCSNSKNTSRVNNIACEESVDGGVDACSTCEECHNYNLRYVTNDPIKLEVLLGTQPLQMELDSGSGKSVISEKVYLKLFPDIKLNKCAITMCLYNGHKILPLGYFSAILTFENQSKTLLIYVVKNGGPPLLGRDFMCAFNLCLGTSLNSISDDSEVGSILKAFPELWRDELGTFNKFNVELQLKETSIPKFFKPRPVPFALKDKVEKELDRLVDLGILVPVNHSRYATPIVPVLKENGKVRIAGDYSVTLNNDLVIDKYPLPRIEEVFAKIGGGENYSKIDLKNAYNQFVLSDASQDLTTINTSKGLFKYTRLVYGLANAPAIFQKSMETLLSGINGVSCWLDDICVTGPTKQIHLQRLRQVLSRLNDAGLRLQREKCEFFKTSVTYLGYVISKGGLQTCPEKVKAITDAPEPTNVTEVKRFIGIVNYYRNFIPNASSILSPLHELLRGGTEWEWGPRQVAAVRRVKAELAGARLLAHYEPGARLVLAVDAGPQGLGAVLATRDEGGRERPLAFASRSLTASERNYSQIHKEATAIIFGVKHFHQYLYGCSEPFILKTDHRPLVSIFNKKHGISITSALRLQRYAIILSAYNYVVKYTSSENNVVADFFSRAPIIGTSGSDNEYDTYASLNFLSSLSPAVNSNDVKRATENDKVLKTVLKYMRNGWPRKINCKAILPYFQCKTDLQSENDCLFRGHRVVIPMTLRKSMLSELHSTHLGITKSKSNARGRMWWPGIDRDIEEWVGSCRACTSLRAAPARAPPAPWPRPPAPWHRVHVDYMSIGQRVYLVVIDAFSKWLDCIYMDKGTTTEALICKLKPIFSTFGIPSVLVSDNDPKINSTELKTFCASNGIKYITSPIYHPASNGQAENSVRMCKKMLKCILMENLTLNVIHEKLLWYLFNYRNSVHCTTGETPAKLMFGRNLRSRLDLICQTDDRINKNKNLVIKKIFERGDCVWVRWYSSRKESWVLGTVLEKIGNRMYKISVQGLNTNCIRHIDQLYKYKGQALQTTHSFSTPLIGHQPMGSSDPVSDQSANIAMTDGGPVIELEGEGSEDPSGENQPNEIDEWDDCNSDGETEQCERSPNVQVPLNEALLSQPRPADQPSAEQSGTEGTSLARRLRPRRKINYKIT